LRPGVCVRTGDAEFAARSRAACMEARGAGPSIAAQVKANIGRLPSVLTAVGEVAAAGRGRAAAGGERFPV